MSNIVPKALLGTNSVMNFKQIELRNVEMWPLPRQLLRLLANLRLFGPLISANVPLMPQRNSTTRPRHSSIHVFTLNSVVQTMTIWMGFREETRMHRQ